MCESVFFAILIIILSSTTVYGSFCSSSYRYDSNNSIIAAVEIENRGIYNLVISVQFLNKPFDNKVYSSDEYAELINRLNVEWRGIALTKVLESKIYNTVELNSLRATIDAEIQELILISKRKHGITEKVEVVYSIGNFYLIEPGGS